MTLAEFGVDPDEPEIEETRYEFETQAGPWSLSEPELDKSDTPAKTLCPDCGYRINSGDPILLDYGREDGLVLACRLCEDCHNIFPSHTASDCDLRESCELSYPRRSLLLYEPIRVTDDEYPNWDLHQLLELDGDLPNGGDSSAD
ncbi:MAG: hypothetical protein ABEI52_12975 [Halobacteriaceae archaeon]